MFGFKYFRGSPSSFHLHYSMGRLKKKGAGLNFWYLAPVSTVVSVPLQSIDIPFAFTRPTRDFQEVTIQGQLSYRIENPEKHAGLLNYSLNRDGKYVSDDPEILTDRVVGAVQVASREITQKVDLRTALNTADHLQTEVFAQVKADKLFQMLGLELLSLAIHSVRPSPEMARALEAEAREALQRNADEAIYIRRNASVEHERVIKENELSTEIAVEEKKRQIRETKLSADIAIEEQREKLVTKKVENDKREADTRAYALEASLKPIRGMDWRLLMATQDGHFDPKFMIALAFREMAENASKIGELNMSPDLLNTLLKK